jgi:hypothetical protein
MYSSLQDEKKNLTDEKVAIIFKLGYQSLLGDSWHIYLNISCYCRLIQFCEKKAKSEKTLSTEL